MNVNILICRDCCCGNAQKHPQVDHDGHLARIAAAARVMGGARVLVTRCLDVCSRSNVVVVRVRDDGRSRTLWLGHMLSTKRLDALCTWLAAGGPRSGAPLPATLALATFHPSESASHCAIREESAAR